MSRHRWLAAASGEFILKRCQNSLVIQRILPAVPQQIRAQEPRWWWCVILRSSTVRAAQWGRQHSAPLPTARILILRAAEHSAIDFLFASPSDTAAAHLLMLVPSQFPDVGGSGEVLLCSCCSSEASLHYPPLLPPGQTLPFLRHVVAAAPHIVCLVRVQALSRFARTHSHRRADVPVGACIADVLRAA